MTQKIVTYSTFVFACLFILMVFYTSSNYYQLGLAIIFYPVLAYFTLRIFPRKTRIATVKPTNTIKQTLQFSPETFKKSENGETLNLNIASVEITDINKRAFLKLIGAAGMYFFLLSLFSRHGEDLMYGRVSNLPSFLGGGTNFPPPPKPSPTGYNISEIDDKGNTTYFGYINDLGEWYVMKSESESGSFRYARGDKSFPANWENREYLEYDYFYNLFE